MISPSNSNIEFKYRIEIIRKIQDIMNWLRCKLIKFRNVMYYYISPEYSASKSNTPNLCDSNYSSFMMILWGLIYGIILSGAFAISWKCFGDIYFSERSRLRLMPCISVLFVSCLLNFNQITGFGKLLDRLAGCCDIEHSSDCNCNPYRIMLPGMLAILMLFLIKFSALLAMPYHAPWWPADWRRIFNRFYPQMHFRVLILMGIWGKMGFIIASSTGQTAENIDNRSKFIRENSKIRSLLGNLVIVFSLTAIYFSSWRNRALGLLISFVIFVVIYLVSMIISWRLKGHDKYSMFACGELAEILLLLSYLAIAKFL